MTLSISTPHPLLLSAFTMSEKKNNSLEISKKLFTIMKKPMNIHSNTLALNTKSHFSLEKILKSLETNFLITRYSKKLNFYNYIKFIVLYLEKKNPFFFLWKKINSDKK